MTKRIFTILAAAAMLALCACSQQPDSLLTKTPFPEFSEQDMNKTPVSNDIFSKYKATIVNIWNNGCGSCIEEMPELEEMYHEFQALNINLIGIGTDSAENPEQHKTAQEILKRKGVTYQNIAPDPSNSFFKDFLAHISSYPTTYVVDSEGNMIGAPIAGNVKRQKDTLLERLRMAGA